MNDGLAIAQPAQSNALAAWLRYDPVRAAEAEAAYTEFVRTSRFGVYIVISIATMFLAAFVFGFALSREGGHLGSTLSPGMLLAFMGIFYGVQALSLVWVPRRVLRAVLIGAVDLKRSIAFAVAAGLIVSVVEMLAGMFLLNVVHVATPNVPNPMAAGVLWGMFFLTVAAPFVEEFQMQAWLQTRARKLGPVAGGILTTIVFVLMHVPKSPSEFVRVLGLSVLAWYREFSKSLAACMVMHATTNFTAGMMLVLAMRFVHHTHVR